MCGIIGICSLERTRIGELLYRGLKRLEYRGYDSAGVAVISNGGIEILKGRGKIDELESRLGFTKLEGSTGIGHTRWATHGAPNDINAHPHVDCAKRFSVVHNGILKNYLEVKRALINEGHEFRSETDTEVVAHLVEKYYGETGDVFESFKMAIKDIRGAYAILMITPLEPNKIFFAKKDSPLVIGLGDGLNLLASDIPALLEHTRKVIALRDYWVGYITPTGAYAEDIREGIPVDLSKYVTITEWDIEDAKREGYPHFMLKEIYEQPRALRQTLEGLLSDARLDEAVEVLRNAEKIYITGAGSSYHASEYFAYVAQLLAGRPVISFISSEYRAHARAVGEGDALIVVSQSGETMDALKALRAFRERGARAIALSNVIDSAIPRESDVSVYMRAGPEIGVAATKTYTSQALSLLLIALKLAGAEGEIGDSEYLKYLEGVSRAPELVGDAINSTAKAIEKLAEEIYRRRSAYYLSRGVGVGVAREGALKLKEIAYIHAEAYPAGESKHGPIALVEDGFPAVFIVPRDDELADELLGNIEEMSARGARTICVAPRGSRVSAKCDIVINVESPHWALTPLTHAPPLQLLAYYTSVKKGYDPDKPRNLAKTVTVE